MDNNCHNCFWNFNSGICANAFYGERISKILKEKRDCNDWQLSFEEFSRLRNKWGDIEHEQ